jgi:glutaredoxin-related protein
MNAVHETLFVVQNDFENVFAGETRFALEVARAFVGRFDMAKVALLNELSVLLNGHFGDGVHCGFGLHKVEILTAVGVHNVDVSGAFEKAEEELKCGFAQRVSDDLQLLTAEDFLNAALFAVEFLRPQIELLNEEQTFVDSLCVGRLNGDFLFHQIVKHFVGRVRHSEPDEGRPDLGNAVL